MPGLKSGMEPADTGHEDTRVRISNREGLIRTLGIGLVAIAAVVASLTLVRQRNEGQRPEPQPAPDRAPAPPGLNLDEIRAAGF